MPYIESLKVFVRVVELGSITAGGRDLRLTPAVASNRIKELENRLDVRLFNRTTRKLMPTEAGQAFYDHARKIVGAIEDGEAAVSGFSSNPHGVVQVSAPLSAGRRIIAPLIPRFAETYPGVSVRLRQTDRTVDLLQDGIDAAFVVGHLPDSNLKQRKIMDCPRALCAAPDYLAKNGTPETVDDLDRHNCLLLRFPRSPEYYWTVQGREGLRKLHVSGQFDSDDGDVLTGWALDGRGIVNKPRFEIEHHLQSGALVEILTETPPIPVSFACLYPHRRLQDSKVRLFIDFIVSEARQRLKAQKAAS
ncbi:LysR family transcriptional regulator [Roseovarius sp. 2305UL8-3]|uniref:LysR family transcriptional regulator n=1 Tax=Roseovarius conchicola TaxID=3121636 RepID=UPI003528FB32